MRNSLSVIFFELLLVVLLKSFLSFLEKFVTTLLMIGINGILAVVVVYSPPQKSAHS